MPLFTEVKEAQTIVILLEAATKELQEIKNYELQVRQAITQLYKSEQLTLDDVCSFMAFGLKMQTGKLTNRIRLANFTFADTKMGSPFSRRLQKHFEKALLTTADYNVTSLAHHPTKSIKSPRYMIKGTYWSEGGKIKIFAILRDLQMGKPIASIDGYLPKLWLKQNNISWKPENFLQAQESMLQFRRDEIVDGNMKLEVWTNNPDESPIFEKGDILQFYIRVSHPCYLQIINHFADETRVLLISSEYIGQSKIDSVIPIYPKFKCSPPFGIEVLQVNVQTEPFKGLLTEKQGNYQVIIGELEEVLEITRGFEPIKNEDLRAEKRIIVTTMERNNQ